MDPIITAALAARTKANVASLEQLLVRALGAKTRFLGDQEANWSSVSSPADATSVLFERPTNMFDAVIEREAERTGRHDLTSPAAAANAFFGVPKEGVGEMPSKDRAKLAADCLISVLDSDDSRNRPTFAFRDKGIGLTPAEMPETILSLQKSNKLRKAYTHGIFGKGGSSASAFSDATIIVARKQPGLLNGADDEISVAVVREDEAADMGLPFLRYNVGADNLAYHVPASDYPQFEPGVYVAHINYQAGKMGIQNWTNEESIYAYAETLLFAPSLPYSLVDARTGAANQRPEDRTNPSVLSGLGQRLEPLKAGDGTIIDRTGWQTVTVPGVGEVRLRWWLFEDRDKRRTRVAKGYVVVFTTNGQIHHAWDQGRFQQLIERRRRVGERVFVQVDCDGIELRRRYKVFDSFRAQVRRGPEGYALEEAVKTAIETDADLDEAEDRFVKETLAGTAQKITAQFRKRLNDAIKTKVPGLSTTSGTKPGRPPKPKRQEDLYEEPTAFSGPEEVKLLLGGQATVFMEINAKDLFVPDKGQIDLDSHAPVAITQVGDLRKGRIRLILTAKPELTEGKVTADLVLTWIRKNGGLGRIPWQLRIDAVTSLTPHAGSKPPSGTSQQPSKDSGDIALIWQGRDAGYAEDTVGDLTEVKGDVLAAADPVYADLKGKEDLVTTIVLNPDFTAWQRYLRSVGKNASDAALDGRRERYAIGVGVVVANLVQAERKIRRKHDAWTGGKNGSEEPPKPMTDEQLRRALAEAAGGVVALLPDFDELVKELGER